MCPGDARRRRLHLVGVDTADIEGDAQALVSLAGYTLDDAPSVTALSLSLLHTRPARAPIRHEADLAMVNGLWRVYIRHRVPTVRASWASCSHDHLGSARRLDSASKVSRRDISSRSSSGTSWGLLTGAFSHFCRGSGPHGRILLTTSTEALPWVHGDHWTGRTRSYLGAAAMVAGGHCSRAWRHSPSC